MWLLIAIVLVVLLCGGGGTYHTWNTYGPAYGGAGLIGTILIIVLVIYLLRGGL